MKAILVLISFLSLSLTAGAQAIPATDILVFLKSEVRLQPYFMLAQKQARHARLYQDLVKNAKQSQAPLLQMIQSKGFKTKSYYITNMIFVENATQELMKQLQQRSEVRKVSLNQPFQVKMLPKSNAGIFQNEGIEPGIVAIGADQVWNMNIKGQNIVIAGQDTGVQWDHPALIRQYRGTTARGVNHDYNWHDAIHKKENRLPRGNRCGYDVKVPCDDQGHGTHTMGTMVGDDGANNKIGVAPGAKWMACRNMDAGVGTPASYIECFEYFFAPYPYGADPLTAGKTSMAPHVINNSWGCPTSEGCQGDEFLPVLEKLYTAGVMVVASAGNEGPGCGTINAPPATHTTLTLSVGAASASNGGIANFSSRGPSKFDGGIGPDIVAPGVGVRSSVPGNRYEGGWSGTSMAGPHVAGMVALIWSAKPALIGQIDQTTKLILATATPKQATQTCGGVSGAQIPNQVYGYGMVNVLKAIQTGFRIN